MSYTKLSSSILTSTLWMEDDHTRIAWFALLAMADKNGEVQASVPGLANIARIPVESARAAIAKFLSPDPDSRTKDDEGRRIQEIKGGWFLINHAEYRELASDLDRRQKAAERQQRCREKAARNAPKQDPVTPPSHPVTLESRQNSQAEAHSNANADVIKVDSGTSPTTTPKQEELIPNPAPKVKRFVPPTREEANAYAVELGLPGSEVDNFMDFYGCKGWKVGKEKMVSWRMCLSRWARKWKSEAGQNGRPNPGASLVSVDSRASYEAYKDRMDPGLVD